MTEKIDLDHLRNALVSLSESMRVIDDQAWFQAQSVTVRNTLLAGAIQNFEFVYEICVKTIRRQLEREALTPTEIDRDNYRDILRHAAEKGLIGNVEAWFGYRAMRNVTSHTYDQEKANRVYLGIPAFLADARLLLEQLERR